jgi:hypothetical protein
MSYPTCAKILLQFTLSTEKRSCKKISIQRQYLRHLPISYVICFCRRGQGGKALHAQWIHYVRRILEMASLPPAQTKGMKKCRMVSQCEMAPAQAHTVGTRTLTNSDHSRNKFLKKNRKLSSHLMFEKREKGDGLAGNKTVTNTGNRKDGKAK